MMKPYRIMPALCRFLIKATLLLLPFGTPVAAQDYPSRPVKIIVPFGAGGPTDVFTRVISDELHKSLGQPFVMENRPGAGTIIGLTTFGSEVIAWSRVISPDSGVQAPEWIADFSKTPPANTRVRVRIRKAE